MPKQNPALRIDKAAAEQYGAIIADVIEDLAPPAPPTIPKPTGLALRSILIRSAVTPAAGIVATWLAPAGVDPESYVVQWSTSAAFLEDDSSRSTEAPTESATITGLKTSTLYYVRVAAIYRAVQSAWTAAVSITTVTDTTPPSAPTGVTVQYIGAGDLEVLWTESTSDNYRATEISIYSDSAKTKHYATVLRNGGRYVWTAADNLAATGGVGLKSAYVTLRSVSWWGVYSSAVAATAAKAPPTTPTGLSSSWASDTGLAAADVLITWNASVGAQTYRATVDGLAHTTADLRLLYTYLHNAQSHPNQIADPVLSISVVAVDALGQVSGTISITATNAAPPAPTVELQAGVMQMAGRITSTIPADLAAWVWEWQWSLDNATYQTLEIDESADGALTFRPAIDGQYWYRAIVRGRDRFGQLGASTTSTPVVLDAITIAGLRKLAGYEDDLGSSPTALEAMKDGDQVAGGIIYS